MPFSSSVETAALARLRKLLRFSVQRNEEQKRVHAQNLHDQVQSLLAATQFDLTWLRSNAVNSTSSGLQSRAQQAIETLQKAMSANSRIIEALRPSLLDNLGLLPALQALVSELTDATGIRVREEYPASAPDLGPAISTVIYRIAEHGLKFVLAHDDIRELKVHLTLPTDRLNLRLEAGAPMATSTSVLRADTLPLEIDVEAIKDYGGSLNFTGGNGGSIHMELSIPVTPS